jgi:hypothetical protein
MPLLVQYINVCPCAVVLVTQPYQPVIENYPINQNAHGKQEKRSLLDHIPDHGQFTSNEQVKQAAAGNASNLRDADSRV